MHDDTTRQTLGDLLRRTRMRHPHKLAIRCGSTDWTYAEFDDTCNRLAGGFAAHGVETGDRVAVIARNSHAFAALRFALARLGAVLVPINFMLSAEEARYILAHSGASLLCVDTGFADLGRVASSGTAVRELVWLPSEDPTEPVPGLVHFDALLAHGEAPARTLSGDMLAQIIYTSGTESRPKGAMLTHAAVISEYVTCLVDAEITEHDRILHALPLYHCAQLDVFLGPAVYVGATNIITGKPTADKLLSLLASNAIHSFFAPPTVWIALLRAPQFDGTDLSALRKGYYGASIMPVEVLKEIQVRLPQVRLWNLYGQTEIAPVATVLKPEDQLRKAGSAGRPALNVETRVVDDAMQDVPPGTVGEIVHRSPQLLSGYFKDEERTREAFQGGWFHSGDLATVDDEGYITVVDRKKDMIKSGGENVSSREVEEALYAIPGVSEVAVIGLPDPRWIEAVVAVVVAKQGHTLDEAEVIAACAGRLAPFKTPKRVILADALPKNPSGKLLKRELRLRYAPSHES
ncbi:fatty acyl-CoA synthetase [Hydrogenophaga sp. OTU3427]|uniref:fatty acyl-CoA synthetase n=1 Tax=Hydrogenophaga sp. OTU3427 TaxID=3043856 RepID=UPI00313B1A8A